MHGQVRTFLDTMLVVPLALVWRGLGSNFLVTLLDSGWPLALLGSYLNTSVLECLLVRLCLPTLLLGLLALVSPGSGSYVLVTLSVLELLLLLRPLDVE